MGAFKTMVDPLKRRQLSQHLRQLVTGRATNDQFDDWYCEHYARSEDRAVQEISSFGYSLYSSDLLWPYRLRGIHAVDKETRRAAARCVLFLRSGLEYEWPASPDSPIGRYLQGLALFLGLPLGIVLTLLSLPELATKDRGLAMLLGLGGVALMVLAIWLSWFWSPCAAASRECCKAGDLDAWPFLRRSDLDRATGGNVA
jgi:hypothetical protein